MSEISDHDSSESTSSEITEDSRSSGLSSSDSNKSENPTKAGLGRRHEDDSDVT